MDVWHNPRCGKSRQCITYLKENNYEFNTIFYLNESISKDQLIEIIHALGIRPIDLVRKNEAIFKEQFKNKSLSDEACIDMMVAHPKLIERPIVITKKGAAIGRPLENIKSIL